VIFSLLTLLTEKCTDGHLDPRFLATYWSKTVLKVKQKSLFNCIYAHRIGRRSSKGFNGFSHVELIKAQQQYHSKNRSKSKKVSSPLLWFIVYVDLHQPHKAKCKCHMYHRNFQFYSIHKQRQLVISSPFSFLFVHRLRGSKP
jgi:hypothetical protein